MSLPPNSFGFAQDKLTDFTIRELAEHVRSRGHAMAGVVIAANTVQACALAEACMHISLAANQEIAAPSASPFTSFEGRLRTSPGTVLVGEVEIARARLLDLADADGEAITRFVALRTAGEELAGQDLLCEMPAEMGGLALQAANAMQGFRGFVIEQVQDDLEMALSLAGAAGRAALLLLDSNLRIWPHPRLLAKYEPALAELERALGQLTPLQRIRSQVAGSR